MRSLRKTCLTLAALGLVFGAGSTVLAAVTPGGSTSDDGSSYYVGYTADGTLGIDGGSALTRSYGYVGYNAGCTGTATVTGASSGWVSNSRFYVGYDGIGILTVGSNAYVTCRTPCIGYDPGSSGTVTLTGTSAAWHSSYNFYLGYSGTGTFNIQGGGRLDTSDTDSRFLGYNAGSTGTVTVSGAGSMWYCDNGQDYVGYSGGGTVNVQAGAQVYSTNDSFYLGFNSGSTGTATVTGTGSTLTLQYGPLVVGGTGTGTVRVEAGGLASTYVGDIGYSSGSTGTVTVTGANSKWTDAHELYIGVGGSGVLSVQSGGQVTSASGYLGLNSGSTGTAAVTGTGSKWTMSSDLYVGMSGTGQLTVSNGGVVTAANVYASPNDILGNGTVTATKGAVLDTAILFDGTHGTTQTFPFGTGGHLNVTFDPSGVAGAGYRGTGTLRIAGGVTFASTYGYLGYNAGATGTATVTGNGSTWTDPYNVYLYVGTYGTGILNIEAGGKVNGRTCYFGYMPGSAGTVAVTGAGSTFAYTSSLMLGYSGSGTLNIQNGGQCSGAQGTYFGYNPGSTGTATVSGNGSVWTSTYVLEIGYSGSGTMRLEAGGQVAGTLGTLGYNAGSTGTATVTGAGSGWVNSGELYAGWSGGGILNVQAGGQVSNTDAYLGNNKGSTGTATVTDAGSKWTSSGCLYVGYDGAGSLNVQAGGQVSSASGCVGYTTTGSGTATVTGTGSVWTNSTDLYIHRYDPGSLTVADGGLVTAGTLWASLADLYGNGTITATKGAVLDADMVFDKVHGLTDTIPFGSGGTLRVTVDGTGSMGAGYKKTGTLRIADGVTVASTSGYLGWDYLASGTATVTGAGSAWNNSGTLTVGSGGGASKLNVGGGGKVTALGLTVGSGSLVRLNVSGNDVIVLGNAATTGSINTNGAINFYADAFLPASAYKPISDIAGRTVTWSGSGWTNGVGGSWANRTFTVSAPTALAAGSTKTIGSGERMLFTDLGSGRQVGASFGSVSGHFSASLTGLNELDALKATAGFAGSVISAWDFDTNISGSEVLLSFDIGKGFDTQDLTVWHCDNSGVWSAWAPDMLTYDSNGHLDFIVTSFSDYAVTAVPEPATLGLLALGGLMAFVHRRRR